MILLTFPQRTDWDLSCQSRRRTVFPTTPEVIWLFGVGDEQNVGEAVACRFGLGEDIEG